MTDNMLLSVIVPVYNAERFLPTCMESLLGQSHQNLEILIVDDASPGNVCELFERNWKADSRIRLLRHETNKGLFAARITGMKAAKGDWVAFVDPDDFVSIDRFRIMLREGLRHQADMVFGDIQLQDAGGLREKRYSELTYRTKPLRDNETLVRTLLEQRGLDWSWHVACGKIYSKELVRKILPLVECQTKHLIMCEDVVFSIAFFLKATCLAFTHGEPYYYVKHAGASTAAHTYPKIKKNLSDLALAFSYAEHLLRKEGYIELLPLLSKWLETYAQSWNDAIIRAPLSRSSVAALRKQLRQLCPKAEIRKASNPKEMLLETLDIVSPWTLSKIKNLIANTNIQCISFDVFDTLVVRPFWSPTDLFFLLEGDLRKKFPETSSTDFHYIRITAEQKARKVHPRVEDISLDDIYAQVKRITQWPSEWISWCKNRECELEFRYCERRQAAWELYDFARYLGKQVVFTSDMYLPEHLIRDILRKAGYAEWDAGYVSNTHGKSKATGSLYQVLLKDRELAPSEVLHIGDNWDSDVEQARRVGMQSEFFIKGRDLLSGGHNCFGLRNVLAPIFGDAFGAMEGKSAWEFLGIRSMLAMVANHLFDNPYQVFDPASDFGARPDIFGFFPLGMHLLAVTQWLQRKSKEKNLSGLHFLLRDGYLPYCAYKALYEGEKGALPCDLWSLNRRVANQLQMRNKADFLAWLSGKNSVLTLSVRTFISLFKGIVEKSTLISIETYFKKLFPLNRPLNDREREVFVRLFRRKFFDQESLQTYQGAVIQFFRDRLFGKRDATVDIGYSCRSESILASYGIPLTPLYIHTNGDIAYRRARQAGIEIACFYDFKPSNTGVVRELFFSSCAPSCTGYAVRNGKARPVFEHDSAVNYPSKIVIELIQQAALDFIRKWRKVFGDRLDEMDYRAMDASLPFEYFMQYSTDADHHMLSAFTFDDPLGQDNLVPAAFWDSEVRRVLNSTRGKAAQQLSSPTNVFQINDPVVRMGNRLKAKTTKHSIIKQFVPYGLMRIWLKARYGMVIDEPLMAYPGFFKRVKRVVKFSLPYGLVEAWKQADAGASQAGKLSAGISVLRRLLRPRSR